MPEGSLSTALTAARDALRHGALPERYAEHVRVPFRAATDPLLRPGVAILDVGGGRHPCFTPADLPDERTYVGLDIDADELAAAPDGVYDETVVLDITQRNPALEARFDLVVSWWVFEHVAPLDAALGHLHSYLRPGGRLVAWLSGGRSPVSLGKRVVPEKLADRMISSLMAREEHDVFPAHYDRCTASGLTGMLAAGPWSRFEVHPHFRGASYVERVRVLLAPYILVEELLRGLDRPDVATHYLVVADA